jgi:hypothetical protein
MRYNLKFKDKANEHKKQMSEKFKKAKAVRWPHNKGGKSSSKKEDKRNKE